MEFSNQKKKRKWIKPNVDTLELKNTYAKGEAVEGMFEGRKTEGKTADSLGS